MRKFFSLIAAVLFAGSMMASVTLNPATQTNVDGGSAGVPVELTIEGVTIAYTGGVNATNSPADFRVFGGKTLTLSAAENISKVVIAGKANKAGWAPTVSAGTITTGASYADIMTKATLEDPLFVVENINAQSITITCNKQLRAYLIQVTLGEGGESGEGGEGGEGGDPIVVALDTLTCAEAKAAAAAGSTDSVYVLGYVTEIAFALKDGSMSFWMADTQNGGKIFEAYKCSIANPEDAVRAGDYVLAKGKLAKFNNTSELAEGCTVEILERAAAPENLGPKTIAEFLELKNLKDTCILTGIVSNLTNTQYGNFDLADETDTVYVYGVLTPEGKKGKFADLDVEEGDTLTIKAVYYVYQGNPQVKDAVFVEVRKGKGGSGEGGEYSYEYEPTEVTEISFVAESMKIEDYTAESGVVYIELVDAAENWIGLEYISSSYDAEAGLAAGVYLINATEEEGTFFASPGGDDEYDYGCYVGMWVDDEYYNPYYLVSGTVTIGVDGSILVSATSYNGSTVMAAYTPTVDPEEAIDNTNADVKAVKSLRHGRLEIERNGNRYNAQGIRF